MTQFHEMTAAQLTRYVGSVHTAQCVFRFRNTGNFVPVDLQAPTVMQIHDLIASTSSARGPLISCRYTIGERKLLVLHGGDRP
jgi:hypothetical protein